MRPGIRSRISPGYAIFFGAFLNLIGFVWWEGPGRSESLQEYIASAGNLVRRDALVSISSIPGYLLFFGGIAVLLRRRRHTSRPLGYLGNVMILVAASAAILDIARVIVTFIAIGNQNLDSPSFAITAPNWLVDTWHPLLLRSLNAFVLDVVLSLLGLAAIAAHDARLGPADGTADAKGRRLMKPSVAIVVGLVVYVTGLALSTFGAERPAGLVEYITTEGSLVRRDALITALLIIPSYLLLFGGIAILLRKRESPSPLLVNLTRGLIAAAVANAAIDVAWQAITLITAGTKDLDAPGLVVTAPDWLASTWRFLFDASGIVTTAALGIALLGLLVNALQAPAAGVTQMSDQGVRS